MKTRTQKMIAVVRALTSLIRGIRYALELENKYDKAIGIERSCINFSTELKIIYDLT